MNENNEIEIEKKIEKKIDKIANILQFPKFYLSEYFSDLKAQVDYKFALLFNKRDKYLEIIHYIEAFEQKTYSNCSQVCLINFKDDLKTIEKDLNTFKINKSSNLLNEIEEFVDNLEYQVERILFLNKTILFCDKKSLLMSILFGGRWSSIRLDSLKSFLLIINDEHVPKMFLEHDLKEKKLTRNYLNGCLLKRALLLK